MPIPSRFAQPIMPFPAAGGGPPPIPPRPGVAPQAVPMPPVPSAVTPMPGGGGPGPGGAGLGLGSIVDFLSALSRHQGTGLDWLQTQAMFPGLGLQAGQMPNLPSGSSLPQNWYDLLASIGMRQWY